MRCHVRSTLPVLLLALAVPAETVAQNTDRLTPELLWQIPRVGAPEISPDGHLVVFGVTAYDVGANRGNTDLFIMPVAGGEPRRLTDDPGSEFNAQWRPDGEWVGFLSARSGSVQLWEIRADGSDLRQVSDVEGGIGNFRYAPSGSHVSFTREVPLDAAVHALYPDIPSADARIFDSLMYRHWDSWEDGAYRHLFVAEYLDGRLGDAIDVMPGERWDTPMSPFGGVEQIAWAADGARVAYTAKKKAGTEYAVSTNSDVYVYEWATESTTNRSDGNAGYDVEPVFSPDGRWVAWLSMERDGYESDRNRIFVAEVGAAGGMAAARELTIGFDNDAGSLQWAGDSQHLYFSSPTQGTIQLFVVGLDGNVRQITSGQHDYGAYGIGRSGAGEVIIASRVSMSAPAELYSVDPSTGAASRMTSFTTDVLAGVRFGKVEPRTVKASDGADLLAWVIYPPDFDPQKSYPTLLYAQGGPQSTVSQFFSYRWNFQLMAANGYVIVAPNRRGVPSFGQAFKEEISGDWGGQAMSDLLAAIDDVAAEPWADETRLGAVGASFGGYTVYWLAGHHEGRFKTFIVHSGVFNLESMYGTTEELFFANFDLGGAYWDDPKSASYERFSPHLSVWKWDTPMLVIHGQQDFRVPVTEGMQAFTALQLKGIPSRFLYFPDEGHWILSPQNGLLWHRVFYDWLARTLQE